MTVTAEQVLKRIAQCANAMSFQSGEPGVPLAGHTLSFLAANPDQIERFMDEGNELWIDGTIDFTNGCLSYKCIDGNIRTGQQVLKEQADRGREILKKNGII